MKKTLTATLLLLFATLGCDRGSRPSQIAQKAPEFSVSDGEHSYNLAQSRGKVVLLNFWASWCQPCVEELPSLMQLHKQMPQLQIIAISIDDDPQAYKDFLKQYGVNLFTVRSGSEGANLKFGSSRPPESFILDRNGVIQRKLIGPQEWTNPEILNYLTKIQK
jgi:thiol-disulfide isomerase/thioredoxin